jgi:ElaB/YqjD/DUF883 family membrane-anchored ribosome-binding protein
MCITLAVAQIAMSAVNAAVAINQANQAADRARQQAMQEYEAAKRETEAAYQETNRKIAESQLDQMEAESDAIRAANKSLGTLRATESALSDSSLGTIFFEEAYTNGLNFSRMNTNGKREVTALISEKYASEQAYINRTTMAANQAENYIAESNARKTGAILGAVGSGLQIGSSYYANQQLTNAIANG